MAGRIRLHGLTHSTKMSSFAVPPRLLSTTFALTPLRYSTAWDTPNHHADEMVTSKRALGVQAVRRAFSGLSSVVQMRGSP